MKTILVLSLKAEKGNVVFYKGKFSDMGNDCRLINEEIDESYHFDDVCDLIDENEAEVCLILAGEGCSLFAARFALSLSFFLRDSVDIIVLSQELKSRKKYLVNNGSFYAISHKSELSFYIEGGDFSNYEAKLSDLPFSCSNDYFLAMCNGVIISLSGLYPMGISGSGKHVVMKNAEEFLKSAGSLKLAFNSAVIFEQEQFDESLHEKLLRVPGFTCHFHYSCEDGNFTFDNSGLRTQIKRISLSEYLNIPDANADSKCSYLTDIKSEEDFKVLRKLLSDFFGEGLMTRYNFWLTNECMFTGNCLLYKFFRYKVEDQNLYPCAGHLSIGKISTPPLKRMACLDSIRDKFGYDCVIMGETFHRECQSLFADYPNIREYFFQKNLYHTLKLTSDIFKSSEEIRISNSSFSSVYRGDTQKTDGAGLPSLCLYHISEKFYVVDIKKMSIITVDPKIAMILECMMKNVSKEDIILSFQSVCHVDESISVSLYEKGYDMIRKAGLI